MSNASNISSKQLSNQSKRAAKAKFKEISEERKEAKNIEDLSKYVDLVKDNSDVDMIISGKHHIKEQI